MALKREGNMIYVDTTTNAAFSDAKLIKSVIFTATHATTVGQAIFQNNGAATAVVLDLRVDPVNGKKTEIFDFTEPLYFPDGFEVTTLSNAILTVVYAKNRGVQ